MMDLSKCAAALETQIRNHSLTTDFKLVQRSEVINTDPSVTPWVGIYQDNVTFDPKTLGRGALNWMALVDFDVIVQTHGDGGAKSEDALGDAVQRVLRAILFDLTFGGTVDMIKKFSVHRAYVRTKTETLDFQHAIISVQAEVRAGENA
jgi:hypothetical protein